MIDIVEQARNHAELLRQIEEISEQPGNNRIVNSPTQSLLRKMADEIERLRGGLQNIIDQCSINPDHSEITVGLVHAKATEFLNPTRLKTAPTEKC